jgi:hypothetical protein
VILEIELMASPRLFYIGYFILIFWDKVLLCSSGWVQTCEPPESWDFRHMPPCPAYIGYFWDRVLLYAQAGLNHLLFVLPWIAGMTAIG